MSSNPHQTLPALERDWMIAWTKKDRVTCERILAEDFLLTSARGVLMSKRHWFDAAMTAFCCERFDWEEIRVRAFGNVAIVHGRATQRASVAGQDWNGRFLLTDVWVLKDGSWQLVSRHGTGSLSDHGKA